MCVCLPFARQGTARRGRHVSYARGPTIAGAMCLQTLRARFLQSHLPHSQAGRASPPAGSGTRLPLHRRPNLLPAPRVGGCGLCLEADVIQTPYSAVFPGGSGGQVFLFLVGVVDPEDASLPVPTPQHTTFPTPILPQRVKKKKKKNAARQL